MKYPVLRNLLIAVGVTLVCIVALFLTFWPSGQVDEVKPVAVASQIVAPSAAKHVANPTAQVAEPKSNVPDGYSAYRLRLNIGFKNPDAVANTAANNPAVK